MSLSKRLFVLVILIFVLSLTAFPTFATGNPPTFVEASFYCNAVIVTYIPGYYEGYGIRVIDGDGVVVSSEVSPYIHYVYPVPTDTYTLRIPLNSIQEEGTTLRVQYHQYNITWINVLSEPCQEESDENIEPTTPAYWQFGGEDAYMGMRVITEVEGNPIIVLLDISNDSEGDIMFYVSADTIAENYPCTGETYPIFQTEDNIHQFHRLSTCEFQLTTGPDFEGKTHVIIFEGLPPQNVFEFTFVTIGFFRIPYLGMLLGN